MDIQVLGERDTINGNSRTKLRKDFVRQELFKNIFNEVREQIVINHSAKIVDPKISEYADRFYRPKCDGIDETEERNIVRYPLYGPTSNPITFWSTQKCDDNFKRWQPLTKPNSEYLDGQWR